MVEKINESVNLDEDRNGLFTPLDLKKTIKSFKKLKDSVGILDNFEVGDWYDIDDTKPIIKDMDYAISNIIRYYSEFTKNFA